MESSDSAKDFFINTYWEDSKHAHISVDNDVKPKNVGSSKFSALHPYLLPGLTLMVFMLICLIIVYTALLRRRRRSSGGLLSNVMASRDLGYTQLEDRKKW